MAYSFTKIVLFSLVLILMSSCYNILGLHKEETYNCYLIHAIEPTLNPETMAWEEQDTVDWFTEGFVFQMSRPTNKCEEAKAAYGDLSSEYSCSCCWEED